jgi:type IV secretion system protein VirB9
VEGARLGCAAERAVANALRWPRLPPRHLRGAVPLPRKRGRQKAFGVAAALLVLAQPALAITPQPNGGDPHIHVVPYDPSEVVELHGMLGFQLTVEFDPAEKIENVAIGDSLGWQVTPNRKANILFLKPMADRPATNMTVVTNLRRYNFRLSLRSGRVAQRTVPYAVRFLYAPPVMAVVEAPPPPAPPVDRNHAYTYQGSPKTLPQRMFDDGQATYFTFRDDGAFPAIFVVDPDGKEAVVNSYMRDGYIVVDRIAQGFVLRRGDDVTRVFNDDFRVEPPGPQSPQPRKKLSWWRR